jgi:hypothetical protein
MSLWPFGDDSVRFGRRQGKYFEKNANVALDEFRVEGVLLSATVLILKTRKECAVLFIPFIRLSIDFLKQYNLFPNMLI